MNPAAAVDGNPKKKTAFSAMEDGEFINSFAPPWKEWAKKLPPKQRWLVDGWIPAQGITILSGQEKRAGKSLLAFQLAYAVAEGLKTQAMTCHTKGPVLYVLAEMAHGEAHDRVLAAARGLGLSGPSKNVYFNYLQGTKLDNRRHVVAIKRVVEIVKPVLIILDTFFYLHDVNENQPEELKPIVNVVQSLQQMGCAVLLLAHLNRTRGESPEYSYSSQIRGSNVLPGVMDYHIAIRKYVDDDSPPRCDFESRNMKKEPGDMVWTFDNRKRVIETQEGSKFEELYPYATSFEFVTEEDKKQKALEEVAQYAQMLEPGVKYKPEELMEEWGAQRMKVNAIRKLLVKNGLGVMKGPAFVLKGR